MLSLLGLRARGPKWLLELLALLQASRRRHAMHGSGLLVLRPGAASDVATDDRLEWNDRYAPDLHAPLLKLWRKV